MKLHQFTIKYAQTQEILPGFSLPAQESKHALLTSSMVSHFQGPTCRTFDHPQLEQTAHQRNTLCSGGI